jgi:PAS domain S-box-containing protein
MRTLLELPVDDWLRTVWESASDAIALSDAEGVVLAANPAYYALYDLAPSDVLGKPFSVIFPAADRVSSDAQYRAVFNGSAHPAPFQAVVFRPDGTERIVESRVSFIEVSGRRTALLSVVRDITDEVMSRRAAIRAEEQQRALLSSLSHDIKSPLSVIRGHAQVLRRHIDNIGSPPPIDRLVAALKQVEASAVQVAELVDELVDIGRLRSGDAPPLHIGPTDLLKLVQDGLAKYERIVDHHELLLRTPLDAVIGNWDATRLERMLDNLLSNAIKYSPEGGTVTVGLVLASRPYLTGNDRSERAGGTRPGVLLTVEDRGIGISSEDLPHVFERFRRGTNVTNRASGSGVGLTSVREVVEQHEGAVSIASCENDGTTVSVWLPLSPSGAALDTSV